MTHTVLFELGCEELPPKSLKALRDALKAETIKGLNEANLNFSSIEAYAAPRRLALHITDVDAAQADTQKRIDGPAIQAAYDTEGRPTKALEGFMRGQGIEIQALTTFQAGKVEKVCYYKDIPGQSLDVLLPQILQSALDRLPIAKRMRSAASRTEFVRPVKWVLLLKDNQVIDATIQDHVASNLTYGHRFHAPEAITVNHANDYLAILEQAFVIADFEKRQTQIQAQVKQLADEVNAQAIVPHDLLNEVTALVEWPVALRATFEERYLAVPQEALITTMQDNQKYFCLVNAQGQLQPYFITVSNIASKDPAQIIAGNEKVVRPRLSDAEFFFLQDQKQSLASRRHKLENMIFQAELGTLWDKSERISKLAGQIATLTQGDQHAAEQAGLLAKCDLSSELVGEFPELQGIAGTYYARLEGLPEEISQALTEQYLPKFAGDQLPQTSTGTALALADRLDTLVGIFGIGQAPTGSKDPFSLRRAAIGVLRLLIEKQLNLTLSELTQLASTHYNGRLREPVKAQHDALNFIEARYRAMYEDQGISTDVILSVQALAPKSPLDFDHRIKAVMHFKDLAEAQALAAANKRVANILAKEGQIQGEVQENLLVEPAEKALFAALQALTLRVTPLINAYNYTDALSQLAELRMPIDAFFDHVMVMADDAALKANRLRLLAQLRNLFTAIADVSMLQS